MRLPNQQRPVFRGSSWRAHATRGGVHASSCSLGKKIKCGIELAGELAGLASCPEDVPGCLAALAGIVPFILDCEDCLGGSLMTPVCGIVEELIKAGVNPPSELTTLCQGHGGCCTS